VEEDTVDKRQLGQTELEVPTIIFGAWAIGGWFWGGTDDDQAVDAIRASIDAGVTAIDTAPVYGMGHSERIVGRAIREVRDQVQVLTKVGLRWDDARGDRFFDTADNDGEARVIYRNLRPDSVQLEVQQSLERLGTDHLDLVQCHWPDATTPIEETMDALCDMADEGLIGAIGVSNFAPDLLGRAQKSLVARGRSLASTQPRYSLIERRIEADVLPWCRSNQVGAIVYSPIERGLLAGAVPADRVFPASDGRARDPNFSAESRTAILAALALAQPIADAHGCSLAQLAAAWCVHRPGVTAAIVGARTDTQARENAGAMAVKLDPIELQTLTDLFAGRARR
jgi:aryl-alcohol dehydrogenase-like predicted oxidoreductase